MARDVRIVVFFTGPYVLADSLPSRLGWFYIAAYSIFASYVGR